MSCPLFWKRVPRRTKYAISILQFPIGMGTGAVYVTLSGLKEHSTTLTNVETFFYFLNMALFLLNVTTLAIQLVREWHFVHLLRVEMQ